MRTLRPAHRRRSGYTLAEAIVALMLTITVSFVVGQWVLGYIQTSGTSLHAALANVEVATAVERLSGDLATTARCGSWGVGGPLDNVEDDELRFTIRDPEDGSYHQLHWEADGELLWRHTTPLDSSCAPIVSEAASVVVLDTLRASDTSFSARAAGQPAGDPACDSPGDVGCRIDVVSFTLTIDGVGDVSVPRQLRRDAALPDAVTSLP